MNRRMWVLAVTAWVGVVIAGSALTWLAIDRAGQQVTGSAATSTTQPPVVGTLGSAPVTSAPPTSAATGPTRRPPRTASPTATPTATPTVTTTRPGTSTTRQPPTSARTETRTWSAAPGFLTVSCSGGRATLQGASPADGWSFERGDESGDSVEVKFSSGQTEVQVRASCVGGVPQFHVESGGGAGDGG